MPTRLRKHRRLRGSRTVGWGQVGQHRKAGGRGGRGRAGLHKHKWSWTVKYAPNHFGSPVFKPPGSSKVARWLNVGQLDVLASKAGARTRSGKKEKSTLDLKNLGYGKLLGGGLVKGAFRILVDTFTKSAKAKVEQAGGEIVTG